LRCANARSLDRAHALQRGVLRPAAVGVDPVAEQEGDTFGVAIVIGDEYQGVLEQLLWLSEMVAQTLWPRATANFAEDVGEKQFEIVVVWAEVAVVDRLVVVGVGPGLEQPPGKSE